MNPVVAEDAGRCVDLEALDLAWASAVAANSRLDQVGIEVDVRADDVGGDALSLEIHIRCDPTDGWCRRHFDGPKATVLLSVAIVRGDCAAVAQTAVSKAAAYFDTLPEGPEGPRRGATLAVDAELSYGAGRVAAPRFGAGVAWYDDRRARASDRRGSVAAGVGVRFSVGAPIRLTELYPACLPLDSPLCVNVRHIGWAAAAAEIGVRAQGRAGWVAATFGAGAAEVWGIDFNYPRFPIAPVTDLALKVGIAGPVSPHAGVAFDVVRVAPSAALADPVALPWFRLVVGLRGQLRSDGTR